MAGRKPPIQVLVRVVNAQHQVIPAIPILLSEGFVVSASLHACSCPANLFVLLAMANQWTVRLENLHWLWLKLRFTIYVFRDI